MPLYELIKARVFAAERIHGDDTTPGPIVEAACWSHSRCSSTG